MEYHREGDGSVQENPFTGPEYVTPVPGSGEQTYDNPVVAGEAPEYKLYWNKVTGRLLIVKGTYFLQFPRSVGSAMTIRHPFGILFFLFLEIKR